MHITEKRVLSRKTREAAINESVDICKENLKRILYAIEFYHISVPIGITVETGKKRSFSLFHVSRLHVLHHV